MTDQEVSKIITEKMGKCYHEPRPIYDPFNEATALMISDTLICPKCKKRGRKMSEFKNPDWTSRERFLDLWEGWAYKQEWFLRFINHLQLQHGKVKIGLSPTSSGKDNYYISFDYLSRYPEPVHDMAEWLKEE